jgi:hypothetical protein
LPTSRDVNESFRCDDEVPDKFWTTPFQIPRPNIHHQAALSTTRRASRALLKQHGVDHPLLAGVTPGLPGVFGIPAPGISELGANVQCSPSTGSRTWRYKLPAIQAANRNNPQELVYDVWKKAGRFETDSQGGWPAGIYGTRRL